jgi:hypothetical protein
MNAKKNMAEISYGQVAAGSSSFRSAVAPQPSELSQRPPSRIERGCAESPGFWRKPKNLTTSPLERPHAAPKVCKHRVIAGPTNRVAAPRVRTPSRGNRHAVRCVRIACHRCAYL